MRKNIRESMEKNSNYQKKFSYILLKNFISIISSKC